MTAVKADGWADKKDDGQVCWEGFCNGDWCPDGRRARRMRYADDDDKNAFAQKALLAKKRAP